MQILSRVIQERQNWKKKNTIWDGFKSKLEFICTILVIFAIYSNLEAILSFVGGVLNK